MNRIDRGALLVVSALIVIVVMTAVLPLVRQPQAVTATGCVSISAISQAAAQHNAEAYLGSTGYTVYSTSAIGILTDEEADNQYDLVPSVDVACLWVITASVEGVIQEWPPNLTATPTPDPEMTVTGARVAMDAITGDILAAVYTNEIATITPGTPDPTETVAPTSTEDSVTVTPMPTSTP